MIYKLLKNQKINNIKINNKYVTTLSTNAEKIVLTRSAKSGVIKVRVKNLKCGAISRYKSEKERKLSKREVNRRYYNKKVAQYRKDIDKTLGSYTNIDYRSIFNEYLVQNFNFNYFHTLTFNSSFKLLNKERVNNVDGYMEVIKQNYISNQKNISLEQFQKYVKSFLDKLLINNTCVFSQYFISYELNSSLMWHAHIVFNIVSPDIKNYHAYLRNKWRFGNSKVLKIKKGKEGLSKVLNYLSKEIDFKNSHFHAWDIGINNFVRDTSIIND